MLQISQTGITDSHNVVADIYYQVIDTFSLIKGICNEKSHSVIRTSQNEVVEICNVNSRWSDSDMKC